MPEELASTLRVDHCYAFRGTFEVSASPTFGCFQFRVVDANFIGASMKLEAKKQAAEEIIEKGYLDKYKDDFSRLRSKNSCRVALVTSKHSQVVKDVHEVFRQHRGIQYELVPVKLNNASVIAEGITSAAASQYDVIMIVRGGGKESDFAVFDDPQVVKAIHDSTTPIIVGIGHTDNNTFADKAADRSETTPSKAARFLVDALDKSIHTYPKTTNQKRKYTAQAYGNAQNHSQNFRRSQAGSAVIYATLIVALIILAGVFFFTFVPKLFESILKSL